jgi:hypothetical protein
MSIKAFPAVLPAEITQTLRTKKTISMIRRIVPNKPPPMYMWLSCNLSREDESMRRVACPGAAPHSLGKEGIEDLPFL